MQIAQTVISGSKALMFFQTSHAVINDRRTDTDLVRDTILSVRTVSEVLRTGDIAGVSFKASSIHKSHAWLYRIISWSLLKTRGPVRLFLQAAAPGGDLDFDLPFNSQSCHLF